MIKWEKAKHICHVWRYLIGYFNTDSLKVVSLFEDLRVYLNLGLVGGLNS